MKTKSRLLAVAVTKMMVAIRQDSIHLLHFAWSSASWPPGSCPPRASISWMTLNENSGKVSSRMVTRMGKCKDRSCWSDPKVSVLELQNSSGLTNIVVSRCNYGIVDVFRFWINPPSRRPQLAFNSSRTRDVFLSVSVHFLVHASCSRVFS